MNNDSDDDFDSPWKEAAEAFLPSLFALCFPAAFEKIDWSRGFEFLDKEFQQIVRDGETGRRHVDKLVKVWLKNGAEEWILIHIELQAQKDDTFPERIYIYNYRIYDRYRRHVLSSVTSN